MHLQPNNLNHRYFLTIVMIIIAFLLKNFNNNLILSSTGSFSQCINHASIAVIYQATGQQHPASGGHSVWLGRILRGPELGLEVLSHMSVPGLYASIGTLIFLRQSLTLYDW